MDERIINFLASQNVSTLAVTLPDNNVHAATMYFSSSNEPLRIYFSTDKNSRKCTGLKEGGSVKAAFASGVTQADMITFQAEGDVTQVTPERLEGIRQAHYAKNPSAKQYENADTIFLEFTPVWWRYSEFVNKVFLTSNT